MFNVSVILINDNMQSRLSSPMLSGGSSISGKGAGWRVADGHEGLGVGCPTVPLPTGEENFQI